MDNLAGFLRLSNLKIEHAVYKMLLFVACLSVPVVTMQMKVARLKCYLAQAGLAASNPSFEGNFSKRDFELSCKAARGFVAEWKVVFVGMFRKVESRESAEARLTHLLSVSCYAFWSLLVPDARMSSNTSRCILRLSNLLFWYRSLPAAKFAGVHFCQCQGIGLPLAMGSIFYVALAPTATALVG